MSSEPRATRRPGRGPVIGLLAVSGVVALVASAQPWWRARAEETQISFSGSVVSAGLSQALAVVLIAGTVLSLTLRVGGRRVLGVLLALTALGMSIVGLVRQQPSADAVRTRVRQVSLADQVDLVMTAWPWVFAAAGLLGLLAATVMVWGASTWPVRRSRFERGTADSGREPANGERAVVDASEDPTAAWQALDAGVDPTTSEVEDGAASDAPDLDPDVHGAVPGVTMERKPGSQSPR